MSRRDDIPYLFSHQNPLETYKTNFSNKKLFCGLDLTGWTVFDKKLYL